MSRFRTNNPIGNFGVNQRYNAPGVTPTFTQPDQTAGQIGGLLDAGLATAGRVVDFNIAAEQMRLNKERQNLAAQRARQEELDRRAAERAQLDAQTQRLQEGMGREAAANFLPKIQSDIENGKIQIPDNFDAQSTQEWVRSYASSYAQQFGLDENKIVRDSFESVVMPKMMATLQNRIDRQAQEEKGFANDRWVSSAIASEDPLATLNEGASALGYNEDQKVSRMVVKAANLLAGSGNDKYQQFRELIDKPEFTLQRQTFDLMYEQQKDQQRQAVIRAQAEKERAIELTSKKEVKAVYDVVNSVLAGAAGDENATYDQSQRWLDVVRQSMVRNPDKATELSNLEDQLAGVINGIDQRRLKTEEGRMHMMQTTQIMEKAESAYASGEGWRVPESTKSVIQMPDGSISERNVPELRRMAQESAIAKAPTMAAKVQMLAGDDQKYAPWASLLAVGAQAGSVQFAQDGKAVVKPQSMAAVELYEQMLSVDPVVARKHAGASVEFYDSVLELKREAGIGNDTGKAIAEQVRRSQMPKADIIEYTSDNIKSDAKKIDGIDDDNYFLATAPLRSAYNRLQRSGVSPERARELAIGQVSAQMQVVNGQPFFAGEHATPPGVYGNFKDTAEAYLDSLKSKYPNARAFNEPVKWDKVQFSMNQNNGKITLVSEVNQPLDIPLEEREFSVQQLLRYSAQAKMDGVIARSKKPKEMRKYDTDGAIPWSRVPAASARGIVNAANFWDERIAKPSQGGPVSFENFPVPNKGPIDEALKAAGEYWDKNIADKSRLKPVSFDYGQGQ